MEPPSQQTLKVTTSNEKGSIFADQSENFQDFNVTEHHVISNRCIQNNQKEKEAQRRLEIDRDRDSLESGDRVHRIYRHTYICIY